MRLAYFLDNFHPQINGVLVSSLNTIRYFAHQKHEILVIAPAPSKQWLKQQGTKLEIFTKQQQEALGIQSLICVNGFPFPVYPGLRITKSWNKQIFTKLKEFQPDIIHFHTPLSLGRMGVRMAKNLHCPLVGTFHTFIADPEYLKNVAIFRVFGFFKLKCIQKTLWYYNNHLFYQNCDKIIAVNSLTKDSLVQQNLAWEKIDIVHNALHRPNPQENNETLHIKNLGKEYFIYTGRLSVEKNIDRLISSAALVFTKHPSIQLLIVGDGPYKKRLQRKVEAWNLSSRIIFTGCIPHKKLLSSQILQDALFFATASKTEAQPLSVLEAMQQGLPCVALKEKGMLDLLQYGNGILVDADTDEAFAAALLTLVSDKKQRTAMGKKALTALEDFSLEKCSKKMLDIYHNLTKNEKDLRKT